MKQPFIGLHRVDLLYAFAHRGGFMYSAPLLLDGDTVEEPLRSKLVLFEDGHLMRRAHEQHSAVAGTGRGAYSHWERNLFFSASDNSDPNTNGKIYSYAVDYAGQHEVQDDGMVILHPPYYLQNGRCWGVAVLDEGDDLTVGDISQLELFEDDRSLGPSHAQHIDIVESGAGAYSHWMRYLLFSTSDGSDPNTNGRLYSYQLKA